MNTRSMMISAAVGGSAMGLLSGIPILNFGNCLFCLWLWVGGVLAVFVYTRMEPGQVSGGEGASVGAVAGVLGALITTGLLLIFGMGSLAFMSALGENTGDDMLTNLMAQGFSVVFWFAINIVFFPAIGALAGLIGVELFGKGSSMPPAM